MFKDPHVASLVFIWANFAKDACLLVIAFYMYWRLRRAEENLASLEVERADARLAENYKIETLCRQADIEAESCISVGGWLHDGEQEATPGVVVLNAPKADDIPKDMTGGGGPPMTAIDPGPKDTLCPEHRYC